MIGLAGKLTYLIGYSLCVPLIREEYFEFQFRKVKISCFVCSKPNVPSDLRVFGEEL